MSERIHGLAQQVLPEKSSLNDYSLEELQHIAKRYPYFAPVQFLLLEKLRESGSPDREAQQRKTVLYFHDVLLYENFIHPENFLQDDIDLVFSFEEKNHEKIRQQTNISRVVEETRTTTGGKRTIVPEDDDITGDEILVQPESKKDASLQPPPAVNHASVGAVSFSEPDRVTETILVAEAEPAVLPITPLQENSSSFQEKESIEDDIRKEETLPAGTGTIATEWEKNPTTLTEVNVTEENSPAAESMPAAQAAAKDHLPVVKKINEPLAFEPFHTVDYFASQGIKVTVEELPKDKLTKQLRSFTDWLKIMKRLPATEMQQTPESPAEKTVENMATHSVEGSDVVTEAMAEVWAKQGNRQKAIETYNKLSLHNPSKKAYFAAKIENLSGT